MKSLTEFAAELQAIYEEARRARESRRSSGERLLGKEPARACPSQPSGGASWISVRTRAK